MMTNCSALDFNSLLQYYKEVVLEKATKLRKGEKLHICFFVLQKQFWSMQSVYDSFIKYDFVELSVVPFSPSIHDEQEKKKNFIELCLFHKSKGANIITVCDHNNVIHISPEDLAPDIVFYEQYWQGSLPLEYQIQNMFDKALCICVPYGIMSANLPESQFNSLAHNLAWLCFIESPLHFGMAKKYATNKAVNVVVSGYPKLDAYTIPTQNIYWKTSSSSIKRVIWAPHYSVTPRNKKVFFSTFMRYHNKIFDYVKANVGSIEVILKPHPLLKSACLHAQMPEHIFDNYMKNWSQLPNASIVTDGNYIDLFATSDAMILDSISFIGEYMVTGKPLCFLSRYATTQELSEHFNEFGKKLIQLIDVAFSFEDITRFLKSIPQEDVKNKEQSYFIDNTLKINIGHSGAFIVSYILKQLREA